MASTGVEEVFATVVVTDDACAGDADDTVEVVSKDLASALALAALSFISVIGTSLNKKSNFVDEIIYKIEL